MASNPRGPGEGLLERYLLAVLAGSSAGANCWFEASVTDSFCPHYDSEPRRRPVYCRLITDGTIARGYAAEDAVAFHFRDSQLVEVVSARPDAAGYEVAAVDGKLDERRLATHLIG